MQAAERVRKNREGWEDRSRTAGLHPVAGGGGGGEQRAGRLPQGLRGGVVGPRTDHLAASAAPGLCRAGVLREHGGGPPAADLPRVRASKGRPLYSRAQSRTLASSLPRWIAERKPRLSSQRQKHLRHQIHQLCCAVQVLVRAPLGLCLPLRIGAEDASLGIDIWCADNSPATFTVAQPGADKPSGE